MENTNETLDQDEFIESCLNLIQTLTPYERHLLLDNKPQQTQEFNFTPRIN
jgi:hypothetical protein